MEQKKRPYTYIYIYIYIMRTSDHKQICCMTIPEGPKESHAETTEGHGRRREAKAKASLRTAARRNSRCRRCSSIPEQVGRTHITKYVHILIYVYIYIYAYSYTPYLYIYLSSLCLSHRSLSLSLPQSHSQSLSQSQCCSICICIAIRKAIRKAMR